MGIIKEQRLFFKEALDNMKEVGSIFPSSQAAAAAMTAQMRQRGKPARILEVGAGTGPITVRIVAEMGDGDQLDAYEINEDYGKFLQQRFEKEEVFRRVKDQCRVHIASIEEIEWVPTYDYIISAIPFALFEPEDVAGIFDLYKDILNPGGTLTYIRFALGRGLKKITARNELDRERSRQLEAIETPLIRDHQVDFRFVLFNAPPAYIHSLRFS